jgi:glutaredoxin 3
MTHVVIWSKDNCPSCSKAMTLLDSLKINYEVRKVGTEWSREQLLEAIPDARSVPQVTINNNVIGGYESLIKYIDETGYNGTGHTL